MKQVIVTIDTEGHAGKDPIRHLIMGETATGDFGGIPLLMDIFDEYEVKGLFFVDFAEAFDYGKSKIEDVVRYIVSRGHDVGVHIHPDHMTTTKKQFLFEYDYDEQLDIIRRCTDLYREIIGRDPVAFRAGKYGANRQTLEILAELGYAADFSQFYGYNKWCHIDPPVTGNESIRLDNGLIEIPVMSYNHFFPCLFSRYDKFDIDSTRVEHQYLLNRLIKQDEINIIVMFVHSFSLLNWRKNVDNPPINYRAVSNLRYALNSIKQSEEVAFTDVDTIISGCFRNEKMAEKQVLKVSGSRALLFYAQKGAHAIMNYIYSKRYGSTL